MKKYFGLIILFLFTLFFVGSRGIVESSFLNDEPIDKVMSNFTMWMFYILAGTTLISALFFQLIENKDYVQWAKPIFSISLFGTISLMHGSVMIAAAVIMMTYENSSTAGAYSLAIVLFSFTAYIFVITGIFKRTKKEKLFELEL